MRKPGGGQTPRGLNDGVRCHFVASEGSNRQMLHGGERIKGTKQRDAGKREGRRKAHLRTK